MTSTLVLLLLAALAESTNAAETEPDHWLALNRRMAARANKNTGPWRNGHDVCEVTVWFVLYGINNVVRFAR